MASTFSSDLKLELMATGENSGTWGDKTNTNLNLLQQAVAGYELVTITANTTLLMTDAALSDARNAVLELSGTITANTTVNIPNVEKIYTVKNSTSGAFTVTLRTAAQTTNFVTWSTTDKGTKFLYSDATDVVDINSKLSTIRLPNQNEIRFEDTTGGEYVSLKAPSTVASNATLTLPNAAGSNGQFLQTDGSGNLSFVTGVTTAGGSDTQVQYNNAGVFAGSSTMTFDGTNLQLNNQADIRFGDFDNSNHVGLQAPTTVNTTYTLTLPSADGTSGQFLKTDGSGVLSFGAVASGKILQVVQVTTTTETSTTSTSYVTCSTLSATITPISASNKVFVWMTGGNLHGDGPNPALTMFRGATNLAADGFCHTGDSQNEPNAMTILDSPSTTSATIYSTRLRTTNGSYVAYFNGGGGSSRVPQIGPMTATLTLFEVQG
jgi:hypothetical protein